MSEWWSYSLADFLLFSPRTYYRLFELYNESVWPAHLATLASGVAIMLLLMRGGPGGGRIVAAILAALWLWVAWAYLWQRYATINWIAPYLAAGFAAEAMLFLWTGLVRNRLAFPPEASIAWRIGLSVFVFALAVQPFIGALLGRSWMQIEIFGIAPDPTVVATLGILVAADRTHWTLFVIPLAWCLLSGATLWAMHAPDAFIVPAAATIASFLAVRRP